MRRLNASIVISSLFALSVSGVAHAGIIWTGPWAKTLGFFGPAVAPPLIQDVKEAFGAASVNHLQVTGVNGMPGVGKTLLGLHRDPLALNSHKVGAEFKRPFTIDEETDVTAIATVSGAFSAVGFFAGMDFANARSIAEVVGQDITAIAFVQTSNLADGIYPRKDAKRDSGHLAPGNYVFRFLFDADVQLNVGAGGDGLWARFFKTHTANLLAVPEPATLGSAKLALLLLCLWNRRRDGAPRN